MNTTKPAECRGTPEGASFLTIPAHPTVPPESFYHPAWSVGDSMRVLDLFCGAGGASMGYHLAWPDAEIVGVDNVPQPDYPFRFIEADALEFLDAMIGGTEDIAYDLIHASPPCQAYSAMTTDQSLHPDLLPLVRDSLLILGHPFVIENVVGSPIQANLMLCGSMFGLQVQRHRYFEFWDGAPLMLTQACNHKEWEGGKAVGVYGRLSGPNSGRLGGAIKNKANGLQHGRDLMEMQWVNTERGITEAIPPAYTQWIGEQLDVC